MRLFVKQVSGLSEAVIDHNRDPASQVQSGSFGVLFVEFFGGRFQLNALIQLSGIALLRTRQAIL